MMLQPLQTQQQAQTQQQQPQQHDSALTPPDGTAEVNVVKGAGKTAAAAWGQGGGAGEP